MNQPKQNRVTTKWAMYGKLSHTFKTYNTASSSASTSPSSNVGKKNSL